MSTCTNTPTATPAPAISFDGRRLAELVSDLCDIGNRDIERADYFRRCFEAICRHFEAVTGILNIRQGARTVEQNYQSEAVPKRWLEITDSLVLRAQTDQATLVQGYKTPVGQPIAYAIATPVRSTKGRVFGGISLVVKDNREQRAQALLAQLVKLLELVVDNAPTGRQKKNASKNADSQTLKSVVKANDYRSIHHLSFAIVNSLCAKLECEQVALALVRRRDVKLLAMSGLDQLPKNTPGVTAIQQAMSVCYDLGKISVVQKEHQLPNQIESSTCRIHQLWHRITLQASVATIPLYVENECIAVIALRRKVNKPFLAEDIERAKILAQSFAPALPLVDRASRSLVRHGVESVADWTRRVFSWKNLGYKVVAAMVLAFAAWVMFGKMDYQVLATCKIVPEHINIVSAPYEGKVANVLVTPGQQVNAGDLLIQMDTRDLQLERRRVLSEIASNTVEKDAFLRERKPNDAFLKMAQISVLETDLKRIEQQLQRSEIRAIQNGTVLPTEIHRRVGQFVTLGEPLIEIAENANWQLEVNASESDSRHIRSDQTALFQTFARPDQSYDCRILKVHPAASVVEQKNVVIVEAQLLQREAWMKVGMEGNIRIKTEPQPIWWIYTHPVIDYMRLKLWL